MAIGDIYELRLRGEYVSQVILNVFHYQSAGTADISEPELTIAAALGNILVASLVTIQCDGFQWLDAYVKHLVDGGAEATNPFAGGSPGEIVAEGLPPHDAWAFRYNRSLTTTRHGQKRIAGIPETWQNLGIAATAQLDELAAVADVLERDITDADGFAAGEILRPVIYSKFLNGELRDTPVINPVSSVAFVRISTQNTRKVYR